MSFPPMIRRLALAYCRRGSRGSSWLANRLERTIGEVRATIRTRDGLRMQLDTSDFIQRQIYLRGTWDEEVAQQIRRRIRPGQLFVDIGANVGFFSLLAAGLGARVVAFEPNPACHRAILDNAKLNGLTIDARRLALADREGSAMLHVADPANIGAGTFRSVDGAEFEVPVRRLADELSERPDLMKIDVEGAEIAVIRGAGERLAPAILMEVSEFSLKEMGGSKDELFALMSARGYEAEIISKVRRSNAATDAIYFQYDALFLKR